MTWIPVNARNSAEDNHYILDAFDCDVMFYHECVCRSDRRVASDAAEDQALGVSMLTMRDAPFARKPG